MSKLRLSDHLTLPLDACTQTFAWIGRKGSGKTYGSGKLVEELLAQQIQTVILDTVGNWYGLRIAADGKGKGFDIPVFGGLRQDLPLLPTAGDVVADVVVETGRSVILDLSQFNFADRKRFAAAFGERLWQRKKSESQPAPLHLVIEECQLIVPQFVGKDETRMVHVYEEIIRLGRNYGIGVSMLTQRPQSVNKEVLTQAECIMAFQINGVPERKALRDWLTYEGGDVNLVNALPSLAVGTCYLWSPQWLRTFQKVAIGAKRTFDASATPKAGQPVKRRDPSPLDVDDIAKRMSATIEKAKAEDPKALRIKIAELQRELNLARQVTPPKSETVTKQVDRYVLRDRQITRLDALYRKMVAESERHGRSMGMFWSNMNELNTAMLAALRSVTAPQAAVSPKSPISPRPPMVSPSVRMHTHARNRDANAASSGDLSTMARRMLTVLAQHPAGLTKAQILVHADYRSSGPVSSTFAQLVSRNWANMEANKMRITEEGLTVVGDWEPLPTGQALLAFLLDGTKLSQMEKALLDCVAKHYPHSITKGAILEATGYASSGPVSSAFAKLVACNFVKSNGPSQLTLSEELVG